MRKIGVVLAIFLLFGALALAQSEKTRVLEWDDPNAAEAQVQYYTMYEAIDCGDWATCNFNPIAEIPVGTLTHENVFTIDSGKHWFAVTASNWIGESGPSNILMINTNRPIVIILRIRPL